MSRWRWLAILLLTGLIALAPALAEARAGGGSSQGSRGSRTYENNSSRPMERSVTPPPSSSPSQVRPSTPLGSPSPSYAPSFAQRHPFMTGLAGGFLGAGLAGMIFGHSAWAAEGSGAGSMFGLILQIALIGGLIWLAIRLFRSRSPQTAPATGPGPDGYARSAGAMAAPSRRDPVEIPVTEADYNAWGQLLSGIQDAWSKGEILRLKRFMTPEMVSYFNEQLAANASRGVENKVEDVQLLKGDVEEAWAEDGFEYVTARLRWSARDYTVRGDNAQVVEGDPSRPIEATEIWTFVRSRGGSWLLSAIQQV